MFATNSIGGRGFDKNAAPVKIVLSPGESITFRYRIVIGGELTDASINEMAESFK